LHSFQKWPLGGRFPQFANFWQILLTFANVWQNALQALPFARFRGADAIRS
jgi:hypothetical protein